MIMAMIIILMLIAVNLIKTVSPNNIDDVKYVRMYSNIDETAHCI
jgi:hypothetical protein